jgi:predicted porin
MNKNWMIGIGMLLPVLGAQAQSNVTAYGLLDVALSRVDAGGAAGYATRLDSGVSNGSRFGLRGTEDLGTGLSMNFMLEGGLGTDTGASQQGGALFGRQSWVGISSKSGWSVSAGRQYSPINLALAAADAAGQIYWVNTNTTGNGFYQSQSATAADAGNQATLRVNNSVLGTLAVGGTTLRAMVGAGDENSSGSGRMWNVSATYASQPLMLTASYLRFRQFAKDSIVPASAARQTEMMIGGAYDFNVLKLFSGYYRFNPSEENKVITATTFSQTSSAWVGTRIPLGINMLIAQAYRTRFNHVRTPSGNATSIGLTFEHPLSKRTTLYTSYGQVNNDANASTGLIAATAIVNYPSALGVDAQALSLGMRHLF